RAVVRIPVVLEPCPERQGVQLPRTAGARLTGSVAPDAVVGRRQISTWRSSGCRINGCYTRSGVRRKMRPMQPSPEHTPASHGASDWIAVLEAEYEAIYGSKPFQPDAPSDRPARLHALHLLLHERRPTALCLSGGGIRSATFGLGVLQALARIGVLGK